MKLTAQQLKLFAQCLLNETLEEESFVKEEAQNRHLQDIEGHNLAFFIVQVRNEIEREIIKAFLGNGEPSLEQEELQIYFDSTVSGEVNYVLNEQAEKFGITHENILQLCHKGEVHLPMFDDEAILYVKDGETYVIGKANYVDYSFEDVNWSN